MRQISRDVSKASTQRGRKGANLVCLSRTTKYAWSGSVTSYFAQYFENHASKKVAEQATVKESLLPAKSNDVLELDEVWSFVFVKTAKYWLWTALCRRTRQIVAFVLGDHSAETCQRLWNKIPKDYRACHTFSDFWDAYQKVFPEETHRSVGKDTGETNHIERWNCTLRQRLARYVRKTLSFSKVEYMHHLVTRWFIVEYNLAITYNHVF